MMSAKLGTLGLLKVKVVWTKSYDVMPFVYNFTNKILSSDSNYNLDVVIWSKFGNSSIFMKEVIIILSL